MVSSRIFNTAVQMLQTWQNSDTPHVTENNFASHTIHFTTPGKIQTHIKQGTHLKQFVHLRLAISPFELAVLCILRPTIACWHRGIHILTSWNVLVTVCQQISNRFTTMWQFLGWWYNFQTLKLLFYPGESSYYETVNQKFKFSILKISLETISINILYK